MQLFKAEKLHLSNKLSDIYLAPPFSVFNTRQQYFRDRMRMWRDIGVVNYSGRENNLSYDNRRMNKYKKKHINGTSIFNPVVCEIVYKWFARKGDFICDPFAGGITRGAIASMLDYKYIGVDISEEQVKSNQDIYNKLCEKYDIKGGACWICSDSNLVNFPPYNLFFTCPPYYNLEKYTDKKDDLSNLASYDLFLDRYECILEKSIKSLEDDSFAVIVVSDIRDKESGAYYSFTADTVKIFQKIGLHYYNEIILFNDVGNLAITSGNYLDSARKVGRQHQNMLVFFKGDLSHIKEKFGNVK